MPQSETDIIVVLDIRIFFFVFCFERFKILLGDEKRIVPAVKLFLPITVDVRGSRDSVD